MKSSILDFTNAKGYKTFAGAARKMMQLDALGLDGVRYTIVAHPLPPFDVPELKFVVLALCSGKGTQNGIDLVHSGHNVYVTNG